MPRGGIAEVEAGSAEVRGADRPTVIRFSPQGWDEYTSWAGDRRQLIRSVRLIADAARDRGTCVGESERLRGD